MSESRSSVGSSIVASRTVEGDEAIQARSSSPTGGRLHGFPDSYRALTPVQKGDWLAGEECKAMQAQGRLQANQVRAEERRLRKAAAKIAAVAPSPCRVEEFERGYPFPPPAENTPMRLAERVLHKSEQPVLWPAHYLSGSGATYDVIVYETELRRQAIDLKPHRGESGADMTAEAMNAARAAGAIPDTGLKLLTEDEHVLKAQIERYSKRRG